MCAAGGRLLECVNVCRWWSSFYFVCCNAGEGGLKMSTVDFMRFAHQCCSKLDHQHTLFDLFASKRPVDTTLLKN